MSNYFWHFLTTIFSFVFRKTFSLPFSLPSLFLAFLSTVHVPHHLSQPKYGRIFSTIFSFVSRETFSLPFSLHHYFLLFYQLSTHPITYRHLNMVEPTVDLLRHQGFSQRTRRTVLSLLSPILKVIDTRRVTKVTKDYRFCK